MKNYQKSLIAFLLSIIFILPAISQETEGKKVSFKVVKEEDGKKSVFDTTLTVSSLEELKEMESLHELLGEDAFENIDIDLDELDNDIKVRVTQRGGDANKSDRNIFIFKDGDDELMSEKIEIIIDGLEMDLDSLEGHLDHMNSRMFYEYEIESEEDMDGNIRKTVIMSSEGEASDHNVMFFSDDEHHKHMDIELEVEENEDGKKIIIKDEDGTVKEYLIEGGEGAYFIDEEGNLESMVEDALWHDKSDGKNHIVVDVDSDDKGKKVIVKKTISVDTDAKGSGQNIMVWHNDDKEDSEKEHEVIIIKKGGDSHHKEHNIWISSADDEDYLLLGKAGVKTAPKDNQKLELSKLSVHPSKEENSYTFSFKANKGNKTQVYFLDADGKVIYKEKLDNFEGTYKKEIDIKENLGEYIFIVISQGEKYNVHKILIK